MNYRELADVMEVIDHLEQHGLHGQPGHIDTYQAALAERERLCAPPKKDPKPEPSPPQPTGREAPAHWPEHPRADAGAAPAKPEGGAEWFGKKKPEPGEDHLPAKRDHTEHAVLKREPEPPPHAKPKGGK